MFKYFRHAANCKRVFMKARNNEIKPLEFVEVHYGAPGGGKTHQAWDRYHNNMFVIRDANPIWFDGYEGQETLLIEEMEGHMPYSFLLGLLDVYPMRLPVKGSFTYKGWKRVIITSNMPPEEWYGLQKWSIGALERRITSMKHYTTPYNPTNSAI